MFNINFSKTYIRNNNRLSNGYDPDQDQRSVGLDLGQNHLQILSADDKIRQYQEKSL